MVWSSRAARIVAVTVRLAWPTFGPRSTTDTASARQLHPQRWRCLFPSETEGRYQNLVPTPRAHTPDSNQRHIFSPMAGA